MGSSLLVVSAKATRRRHGKARLDQRLGARFQVLGQASDHALHPRQSPPRQPPARPSPTQGTALPTWRLSQTEGGVQEVQGGVDAGPGQALDGSLVTGTQQALTWVPGLCAQSEGGPVGRPHGGSWGVSELPGQAPTCPTHPWASPSPVCRLHPAAAWGQAGATLTLPHSHQTLGPLLALLPTPAESDRGS